MHSALLTPKEFDTHLANGTLRLSFVGMSNGGKSYRSKILHKENDFFWYQVDDDIQKALGFKDQNEISAWMGYPSAENYEERERAYLELENKFTSGAAVGTHGKNLVFDTTGSVIHLAPETLEILGENTLVVHLDVGDDSLDSLIERFFREPKPVAWSGHFSREEGESEEAALRRSYPKLLKSRLEKYRSTAHLNIDANAVFDRSGDETLRIIRDQLGSA